MLKIHQRHTKVALQWNKGDSLPRGAAWIDLLDPDASERAAAESWIAAPLPERDEISTLGLSSHPHEDQRVLCLHAHLYSDDPRGASAPLGMLVTQEQLVTLRYQPSRAFDQAVACLSKIDDQPRGADLLVILLDAITNDVADQMQDIAGDVARLSDDIFDDTRKKTGELRQKLIRIGQLEARLAHYRIALLGIGRVVGFVQHRAPDWIDEEAMACIKVAANDLKVLDQFDEQLTGKLQFLQDAVLGFINTDQNAVMKLLTVASVVTIPPVILAGVWGMNFRHMPELDKVWGYPMALAALFVSMLLPLIWFAIRGWISRD
ncbi:MAG: CorA family divalent cation transporter [Rhodanobacter sp.]